MARSLSGSAIPKWVLKVLPHRWRRMISEGRASIRRDPSLGYILCTEDKCWKILKKLGGDAARLAKVMYRYRCLTILDVARLLGVPRSSVYARLRYYLDAGLLYRDGPFFCLNMDHPQIPLLIDDDQMVRDRMNGEEVGSSINNNRLGSAADSGFSIWCCSGAESMALDLISKGLRDEVGRLSFKIGVACLARRCFRKRGFCRDCFFRDICGVWISPRWFLKIRSLREPLYELALHNDDLRNMLFDS